MKIVVFGLSITSAWGNGHATLLRGLFRALHEQGHQIHFFERDTAYYAPHRDASTFPYAHVRLYNSWSDIEGEARHELSDADVGLVTSYCPDGRVACDMVLQAGLWRSVFYDMDTPVTLSRLDSGESIDYLPQRGLADFDLVLSYTGGIALEYLRERLGAKQTAALYGWVDPATHYRQAPSTQFAADLTYLGTYAADRQQTLENLFIEPARRLPNQQFLLAGVMYPDVASWPSNIRFLDHVAPPRHGQFYSSSPLTLNVTRGSMAAMGYCPSGRLFEAAACGTAVLSDWWEGLDSFFHPGEEILIANSADDAMRMIASHRSELATIARRARERTLSCHTAEIRALRFVSLLESSNAPDSTFRDLAVAARS